MADAVQKLLETTRKHWRLEMVLNGKTLLALDALQADVVHQALCQYRGPYGDNWQSLGPAEISRNTGMLNTAKDLASEIGLHIHVDHAQD